jgi:hypothetical protein
MKDTTQTKFHTGGVNEEASPTNLKITANSSSECA